MMRLATLSLLASLAAATSGLADDGRFSIKPAGDGFIKLDKKTGGLTHCHQVDTAWTCKVLNDENGELNASVEQLLQDAAKIKQEKKALRTQVARLEVKLAKLEAGPDKLKLPSDQDVDKIMGFFEKLFERFLEFARKAQEKPGEPT